MRRWILIGSGICLISFGSAALGVFAAADIVAGDGTPIKLRAWGFQDLSGKPPILASKTVRGADHHGSAFYTLIPEGESGPAGSMGVAVRQEGNGGGSGATFYAENEGGGAPVWGLNAIGATYNGTPAVGMEVNGVNRSGRFGLVRGIDLINGGDAPTEYALGIATSVTEPAGKPRYGIVLAGPAFGYAATAPASRTGILIDHIDSGEAIRIAAGDFISLDGARGRIRMRYNPDSEAVELYNGDRLAHAFPM